MKALLETQLRWMNEGRAFAQAIVLQTKGSAPQSPGARLLLREDGTLEGTVGGGAIEEAVLAALRNTLASGAAGVHRWDLGRDLGMCCGGTMEVFVERFTPKPRLILIGAGHVARPTAAFAKAVGFELIVVDEREELNTEERFPQCLRSLSTPEEAVELFAPTDRDWVVVMTHDHALDERALRAFGGAPHHYLGMIGSQRKVYRLLQRLKAQEQLPPLDRVYAPVGLDIGAVSPEEIGISVVAELVALRRGTQGDAHLRVMQEPKLQALLEES